MNFIVRILDHRDAKFFDERGLIEHALALEHAARVFPEKTVPDVQRLYWEVMVGAQLPAVQFHLGEGGFQQVLATLIQFRAMLERLVHKARTASAEFGEEWVSSLSGLTFTPVEIREDGSIGSRMTARDLRCVLAYVLALLMDGKNYLKLGKALGCCQLSGCGRYFLSPASKKGGRPRTRYCSEEHMLRAHKLGAATRVGASRKGITVSEYRKQMQRKLR